MKAKRGRSTPFDQGLAEMCWEIGLSVERTAWVLKRSVTETAYWWSVWSGQPIGDDPDEDELKRRIAEIEAGWTPAIREAARRRMECRDSSSVVKSSPNGRAAAYWNAKAKQRATT